MERRGCVDDCVKGRVRYDCLVERSPLSDVLDDDKIQFVFPNSWVGILDGFRLSLGAYTCNHGVSTL